MANLGTLTAYIGLDTAKLQADSRQAQGIFSGLAGSMGRLTGIVGTLGVAIGGLAVLKNVTETGVQFDQTMTTVAGVMRATTEEMDALTASARKMGETTEWTASQSGDALLFLGMAGFKAVDAMKALPGTLDLATAGNIQLGRAADIATNALTAMRLPVEQLGRVNDVFIGTITRSNVNMEMMAESFKYAAPVARAYGYEIEELSGLIGMLGNAGIQGSMAGTQLAMAIQKAHEISEEFGLSSSNLVDVIEELRQRGMPAAEVMKEFGLRAGRAAGVLYEATEQTREFQETLRGTAGEASTLAEKMRSTVGGAFKELRSVIESYALDIFDTYKESLRSLVKDTISWLRENKDEIVAIAGVLIKSLEGVIFVFQTLGSIIGGAAKAVQIISTDVLGLGNELDNTTSNTNDLIDSSGRLKIHLSNLGGELESTTSKTNDLVDATGKLKTGFGELIKVDVAGYFKTAKEELEAYGKTMQEQSRWLPQVDLGWIPESEIPKLSQVGDEIDNVNNKASELAETIKAAFGPSRGVEWKPTFEPSTYEFGIKPYIEPGIIKESPFEDYFQKQQEAATEAAAESLAIQENTLNAMLSGYDTFWRSILDIDMTGAERREAIFRSIAQSFMDLTGQMTKEWIKNALLQKTVTEETEKTKLALIASSVGEAISWMAKSGAAAVAEAAKFIYNAVAKIYSWYASLGPFGIPAAAGTVAAMVAAIKKFASFAEGGLVGGDTSAIDEITAFLTKGEFVMPKKAVQSIGVPALEYMKRTGDIPGGGGGTIEVKVDMGGFSFTGMDRRDTLLVPYDVEDAVVLAVKSAIRKGKLEL